jgi:lysozyme
MGREISPVLKNMNKQKIIDQLIIDEDQKLVVYRDSLGYLTVGVGHLVLPTDKLLFGDTITEERCRQFLEKDLDSAIKDCEINIENFYDHPEEIQNELVNLMFNLGYYTFSKFKNFISALNNKQYKNAASDLKNSLWYKQTGIRAKRIVEIFKNIGKK